MSKSITLEPDVRMYLACILVQALADADETLVVPDSLSVR
jgi:hypothetical protein